MNNIIIKLFLFIKIYFLFIKSQRIYKKKFYFSRKYILFKNKCFHRNSHQNKVYENYFVLHDPHK